MTTLAGFRVTNGVLIGADRQHSSDRTKWSSKKIFSYELPTAKVVIAEYGDEPNATMTVQYFLFL